LVIANFLIHSRSFVPTTHLAGILIFHALFLIFGFSAARAVKAVLLTLLGSGAIYLIVVTQYVTRFGDLVKAGSLQDIFGVGNPNVFATFHQNMGIVLGMAALAALGLASNRVRQIFAIGALPLVLLFMFHISARGALVALVCSLVFLAGAGLWIRSKKLALLAVIAVMAAATLASGLAYQRSLQSKNIHAETDAISRTVREIQNPRPGLRLAIWTQTWHRISSEPDRLLFGRGIGMYPVIEGFGAPDWLLRKTKASRNYPHNVYLEMLYETGIVGLLLFGILTLLPLGIALGRWHLFSLVQKSAISMYVFQVVSSQFSGGFAFGYLDQFFFALAVGIIALNRADDVLVREQYVAQGAE
jgi:O-antigen ligase